MSDGDNDVGHVDEHSESVPGFHRQMGALLWKNALIKSRTPKTTLCEIFSPVLMMSGEL